MRTIKAIVWSVVGILLLLPPMLNASPEPIELKWDNLIPDNYRPDKILAKYGDLSDLSDDDPRADQLVAELEAIWEKAPIKTSLDGKLIKLAGFLVPLEGDGNRVSEFLLVPYYGACIHVPPPPANQIVYVKVPKADAKIRRAFDTVWVIGTLSAKSINSEYGIAGYQLSAENVAPYEQK